MTGKVYSTIRRSGTPRSPTSKVRLEKRRTFGVSKAWSLGWSRGIGRSFGQDTIRIRDSPGVLLYSVILGDQSIVLELFDRNACPAKG